MQSLWEEQRAEVGFWCCYLSLSNLLLVLIGPNNHLFPLIPFFRMAEAGQAPQRKRATEKCDCKFYAKAISLPPVGGVPMVKPTSGIYEHRGHIVSPALRAVIDARAPKRFTKEQMEALVGCLSTLFPCVIGTVSHSPWFLSCLWR